MPRASVDKYGNSMTAKREIRESWQSLAPAPTHQAMRAKDFNHPHFRLLIAATFDRGHDG
jgi:hypothetical protein